MNPAPQHPSLHLTHPSPPHCSKNSGADLLKIRSRKRLHHTRPIHKPGPKNPIRILKHAVLEGDNNELGALKSSLDKPTDILRMREIERGVHFV